MCISYYQNHVVKLAYITVMPMPFLAVNISLGLIKFTYLQLIKKARIN